MAEAKPETATASRLTRWIEELPGKRTGSAVGMAVTLAIVGIAWVGRILIDDWLPPGFPYVTFFPAVVLTAFLYGVRLGSLSALLCGLIAWYYFVPPVHSFRIAGAEVALGLYVFVVGTDLALVYAMQLANRQLRHERQVSRDLALAQAQAAAELQERDAERRKAMDALRESEVKTQLATRTAGIGLWQWNVVTDEVRWDSTMFDLYGLPPTPDGSVVYADYIAALHPEDADAQNRILQQTVANCGESTREFRIIRATDGSVRHLRAVEVARAGPGGGTEWVVGTNLDITEQKNRERHVRMLLGEVNHRAKNLLAVVLSVAKRTRGTDHETFIENFAARIRSLAAGQDLLVVSEWKGVQLDALILAQLGHFKDLIGDRIILEGESVSLSSGAVQAIGMAIHELVTNASKYGALSTDRGRVALSWHRETGPEGERFVMTWTESEGPPVTPPARQGFGSTVTVDMIRMSLEAEVETAFTPAGYAWRFACPIENMTERERT